MKFTLICICTVFLLFKNIGTAQNPTSPDPADLILRRKDYSESVKRAMLPLLNGYLKTLSTMRDQYTRTGNLSSALAVETEMNKVQSELQSLSVLGEKTTIFGLSIVSAQFSDLTRQNAVDVTENLRKLYESGQEKTILDGKTIALGKDPHPGVPKETIIIYEFNGRRHEKVFKDRAELNFKKDLK
jgi:hypothetical protein